MVDFIVIVEVMSGGYMVEEMHVVQKASLFATQNKN